MPKKPLKRKQRKASGLTEEETLCLVDGSLLVSGYSMEKVFGSLENAKKKYFENRDFLMSLRGKLRPGYRDITWFDHGHRPSAFWKFEASGPRRFLHYQELVYRPNRTPSYQFEKVDHETHLKVYESQFSFLKRNGLLLDNEEKKYNEQEQKKKQAEVDCRNRLKGADLE